MEGRAIETRPRGMVARAFAYRFRGAAGRLGAAAQVAARTAVSPRRLAAALCRGSRQACGWAWRRLTRSDLNEFCAWQTALLCCIFWPGPWRWDIICALLWETRLI